MDADLEKRAGLAEKARRLLAAYNAAENPIAAMSAHTALANFMLDHGDEVVAALSLHPVGEVG